MIERLFFVHFVDFWSRFRVLDATNPLKNSFMTHLLSGSRLKGGSLKAQHGRAPRASSGYCIGSPFRVLRAHQGVLTVSFYFFSRSKYLDIRILTFKKHYLFRWPAHPQPSGTDRVPLNLGNIWSTFVPLNMVSFLFHGDSFLEIFFDIGGFKTLVSMGSYGF